MISSLTVYSSPFADTDTDYSESEALSSLPMSGPPKASAMSPPSMSDSEHHEVLRIETKTAPKPSQVEVVLSDGKYIETEIAVMRARVGMPLAYRVL